MEHTEDLHLTIYSVMTNLPKSRKLTSMMVSIQLIAGKTQVI